MMEDSNLKLLIQKLTSPLPEIQSRSLQTLYTKLLHNIISPSVLPSYPELPGILMTWINYNQKKSDTLLKVIHILKEYSNIPYGALILCQYYCLYFCQEFKKYLMQNYRGIDDFVQELDAIVGKLSLVDNWKGYKYYQYNIQDDGAKEQRYYSYNAIGKVEESVSIKTPLKQLKIRYSINFTCQNLPLEYQKYKYIFELLMSAKYANISVLFGTLSKIRQFIQYYAFYHFRCKVDLFKFLVYTIYTKLYTEICIDILMIILIGCTKSQNASKTKHLNSLVHLTYGKISYISTIQIQFEIPQKVYEENYSYFLIDVLIKIWRMFPGSVDIQYLLSIRYPFSYKFLVNLIEKMDKKYIYYNAQLVLEAVYHYNKKFTECAPIFIDILPEKIWKSAKSLSKVAYSSQKQKDLYYIKQYLPPNDFYLTKNLHILRYIVYNLKKSRKSVSLQPKSIIKLYLDLLLIVTISVSRKDPLMSYFSEVQDLFIELLRSSTKSIRPLIYSEIFYGLKNIKPVINYPGMLVHRSEVLYIIFSSYYFCSNVLQSSLIEERSLETMLQIVIFFIEKDKFKAFTNYINIFFMLNYHPKESVAILSNQIISTMPKNHKIWIILCKMFSSEIEIREKTFVEIFGRKEYSYLTYKISCGHYKNKKKYLKLSQESIDNFMNMILNPSLATEIRDSAISEFIDCVERVYSSLLSNMADAQICLNEEIKKISKKYTFNSFYEKIIWLYVILEKKIGPCEYSFSVYLWISMLYKVQNTNVKVCLLTKLFLTTFQSPFTQERMVKNWVSNYYPHLYITYMTIYHPESIPEDECVEYKSENVSYASKIANYTKNSQNFLQFYQKLLCEYYITAYENEQIYSYILESISIVNIKSISKLSFLCFNKKFVLSPQILQQLIKFIRTNPSVEQIDYYISCILYKCALYQPQSIQKFPLNISLALSQRTMLDNETLNILFSNAETITQKSKLFEFLIHKYKNIKVRSLSEYTILKLVQYISTKIRSMSENPKYYLNSQALILLNKLCELNLDLSDHTAGLLNLIKTIVVGEKINPIDLGIALHCYAYLLINTGRNYNYSIVAYKMTLSLVYTVVDFIAKSQNSVIPLISCVNFLNAILRSYISSHAKTNIKQIINNHPNNIPIILCSLPPRKLSYIHEYILTSSIANFLSALMYNDTNIKLILLTSTEILHSFFNYVNYICYASKQYLQNHEIELLESVGYVLHILSENSCEFIQKLNKTVKSINSKSEFYLHYTLMSPILKIKEYNKNKRKYNFGKNAYKYVKMVANVFLLWKQYTRVLEEVEFVYPLVTTLIDLNIFEHLSGLLSKSSTIQRLTISNKMMYEKMKSWVKIGQELLLAISEKYSKTSNKETNVSKSRIKKTVFSKEYIQNSWIHVYEGVTFVTSLFSVASHDNYYDNIVYYFSHQFKDTVVLCVRFVDTVYSIINSQEYKNLYNTLNVPKIDVYFEKMLKSIFRSPQASKIISALIAESNIFTVSSLLEKIEKSGNNLIYVGKYISLLGSISCNESVRSIIIKHRIIENIVNVLITMDYNKIYKINYGFVYRAVTFFSYLSVFKDTNMKIQVYKKLLDFLTKMISLQQSYAVYYKILNLLINLASYKHSKSTFMACKYLHKLCMFLLSYPEYELKDKILQLLYNILYKNAAGIKMYKKKYVIEILHALKYVEYLNTSCKLLIYVLNGEY